MLRGYPYTRGRSTRYIRSGANLDRRPCELRVSGFSEDEKDEIVAHFAVSKLKLIATVVAAGLVLSLREAITE